jgi:hypothetical protein
MTEQDYCRTVAFGLIRAADAALWHAHSLLDAAKDEHRDRTREVAQRTRRLGDDLHNVIECS